ncbi:hypothetical protein AJ80_01072 [Polytolypa hystricis UAMH7299]|uniref:Uncharacterized protein n=1 Tax=Polytolypa hystricis (strain UAMH7299) TaxID=1447883 RepID=A0A2B7YZK3_POLH7|nr:hypothetical protein AJ80_01072 [Polytolypa hystricis UAMH7299]
MNTIRSTWVGWGALCVAGGGAYYFAKQAINADRAKRHEANQRRKEEASRIERNSTTSRPPYTPRAPPTAPAFSSTTAAGSSISSGVGGGQQQQEGDVSAAVKRAQGAAAGRDDVSDPSAEVGHDPAPTRHEPDSEAQRVEEKGKYEAAEPFRSKKGNRL